MHKQKQNTKLNPDQREYFKQIPCAHKSPHSTQTPEQADRRVWVYKHFPTYDELFIDHLDGKQSLATTPTYYPFLANIDVDNPKTQEKAVFDKLDELQIRHDQLLCVTTPRYRTGGNFRVYFKLELKGEPAAARLQNIVLKRHFPRIETNPRPNVSDRLIWGFGSEIIDLHSKQIIKTDLRGKLDALKKLRPVEINELPFASALPTAAAVVDPKKLNPKGEFLRDARELYEYGLQKGGWQRYDAQHRVIFLLWKTGLYSPEEAAEETKQWIRAKHNNLSDSVNIQDWRRIDNEIDRQVKKTFSIVANILPDAAHNRTVKATRGDVLLAAKFAPGDAAKQKQFFNLIKLIRPRFHWQWISIRCDHWRGIIASKGTWKSFKEELITSGLMIEDKRYIVGSESRKYKFNFQLDEGATLEDLTGRNIDSYEEAVCAAFKNGQEIKAVTNINERTIRRYLENK